MSNLYSVKVSFDYVVAVKDGEDPAFIATEYIRDAFNDMTLDYFEVETNPYQSGDVFGWSDDCIPYNGDGNKSTGEYLSESTN